MSPTSVTHGSVRSAAELNERIRTLWQRAGGTLSAQERVEYEALVVQWAAAIRHELLRAA